MLKKSIDVAIKYEKPDANHANHLHGSGDSGFAQDANGRQSKIGYVDLCSGGGTASRSQEQCITSLSNQEAGYIALNSPIREALWLVRQNSISVRNMVLSPTLIYADYASERKLKEGGTISDKLRHIEPPFHYRKEVTDGTASLVYMPISQIIADVLTRSISKSRDKTFIVAMRMGNGKLLERGTNADRECYKDAALYLHAVLLLDY